MLQPSTSLGGLLDGARFHEAVRAHQDAPLPNESKHHGDRDELETSVRERCAGGDLNGAATVGLEGYGGEVFGFLVAMRPKEDEAARPRQPVESRGR